MFHMLKVKDMTSVLFFEVYQTSLKYNLCQGKLLYKEIDHSLNFINVNKHIYRVI
jgi:hypothetical protein